MEPQEVVIKQEINVEIEAEENISEENVDSHQIEFKTELVKDEPLDPEDPGAVPWDPQEILHDDNEFTTTLSAEDRMDIASFSQFTQQFINGVNGELNTSIATHFLTEIAKTTQITLSSKSTKYICEICQKCFANNANLQRHQLIHTRARYTCEICSKDFSKEELLKKHALKHLDHDARPYPCDECDKAFKSTSNLMQHKKSHLPIKPHVCQICDRAFAVKANLVRHQTKSRCKEIGPGPFPCHVCNKEFPKEVLLKSHLRTHDEDRPFKCDLCSQNFKHKSTLIRHLQWHNGQRPVKCKHCPKTFTHFGLLKPHLRVHTGEKPYQCTICFKHFAHKHNMERHKINHGRIKRLVCDICNKRFPRESRLIYHIRSHINEKHFKCGICSRLFSHKQNILRHYSRKHPGCTWDGSETDASVALKVWDKVKDTFQPHYDLYNQPEEILG